MKETGIRRLLRYADTGEATCSFIKPHRMSVAFFDSVVVLTASSDWDIELSNVAMQKASSVS